MAKSNSQEKLKVIKGGVEYEIEPAEELNLPIPKELQLLLRQKVKP